jgi:hypothetical protein
LRNLAIPQIVLVLEEEEEGAIPVDESFARAGANDVESLGDLFLAAELKTPQQVFS